MSLPFDCFGDGEKPPPVVLEDRSDWMSNLPPIVTQKPLSQIAIPGSHDSFTNSLDKNSGFGPDVSDAVKLALEILGNKGKDIMYAWSVTQSLSCSEQLRNGIRYFDVRVVAEKNSEFRIIHALLGKDIRLVLNDIKSFLKNHKREIVLIDFNHFYEMSVDLHVELLKIIEDTFSEMLCKVSDISTITLEKLWTSKKQVLVFYHVYKSGRDDVWPGSYMPSPWANTTEVPKLINFLNMVNENYDSYKNTFLVYQGVLTPDAEMIIKNFTGSLKKNVADKCTPAVTKWVKNKSHITIVIADFVELGNFIGDVISLNYPRQYFSGMCTQNCCACV